MGQPIPNLLHLNVACKSSILRTLDALDRKFNDRITFLYKDLSTDKTRWTVPIIDVESSFVYILDSIMSSLGSSSHFVLSFPLSL